MSDPARARKKRPLDDPGFAAESLALLQKRATFLLLLAYPMYISFWGLDVVISPEHKWLFGLMRLIGTAIGIPCIALVIWGRSSTVIRAASVIAFAAIPTSVVIQTYFASGFDHIYYVFITIPMYVGAVILPWSKKDVIAFLAAVVVPYFGGNAIVLAHYGANTGHGSLAGAAQAFFFMSVAGIFTYVSIWQNERARYADFSLRRDLEKANTELRELDLLKTRFFANVSHELRTPLTLILAPVENMLVEEGGPPPRRALETVHTNAVRLLKLVNTLLDFARLDEGKVKLNVDNHQVGEIVKRISESAMGFAERRGIALTCDVAPGVPPVWSDLDMVEKVVYNLLSNALKFTPDGGQVSLGVWADEERFWVSCRDTGAGIPPEQIATLFERFQQVSSQSRASGSGIGLSLARELIRLHKGDIHVASDVGHGAEFKFWLPLKSPLDGQAIDRRRGDRRENERRRAAEAAAGDVAALPSPIASTTTSTNANTTPASAVATAGGSGEGDRRGGDRRRGADRRDQVTYELPRFLFESNEYGAAPAALVSTAAAEPEGRILIADDHLEMREYIRSLLVGRYEVIEASNGREALEKARTEKPDIILADYMMPEMDGMELLKALRADAALSFIPAIVITARAEISARLSGLRGGANDYLVKPFHPEELRSKVDAFMRLRRYEDEIARKSEALAEALEMRKRLEAELVQHAKMASIGCLASGIAHEFNNPVNFILNFARPLARGVPGLVRLAAAAREAAGKPPAEVEAAVVRALREEGIGPEADRFPQAIESIIRGAERIAGIVKGLMALVRREAVPEPFDLHSIVRDTLAVLDTSRPREVPVHVRLEAAAAMSGYAGPLGQVILNLATNAVQAVSPKGNVWITARDAGGEVEITVEDDGPGLTEAARAHLFEPFFTTKKVGEGTGLGLYLVYRIVTELLGGTVRASAREGGGTSFAVRVPRQAAAYGTAAGGGNGTVTMSAAALTKPVAAA